MERTSTSKPAKRGTGRSPKGRVKHGAGQAKAKRVQRDVKQTGRFLAASERFEATMRAAERSGLLDKKSGRIGGRVSPALIEQAKRQTGIEADTDLIEFALATVALEDKFADMFKASRGKVDPRAKLGF